MMCNELKDCQRRVEASDAKSLASQRLKKTAESFETSIS